MGVGDATLCGVLVFFIEIKLVLLFVRIWDDVVVLRWDDVVVLRLKKSTRY